MSCILHLKELYVLALQCLDRALLDLYFKEQEIFSKSVQAVLARVAFKVGSHN